MSLKILGGMARGHKIQTPADNIFRPMAVTLKRRIFDAFQDLSGVSFLDLCAGSGAVGIEAWSRGATRIYASEISKKHFSYTKNNFNSITDKYPEESKQRSLNLRNIDCLRLLEELAPLYASWDKDQQENTVIFFAPPYPEHKLYEDVLCYLVKSKWFCGQLWVESDDQKGLPLSQLEEFSHKSHKSYRQGTTFLALINF